jgi:hypothetical protein
MGDPKYVRTSGRRGKNYGYLPREQGNVRACFGGAKYEVMPNGQWRRIRPQAVKQEGGAK